MNTQHLQYLIEIERTRSVSQAAENLFIGQPNLSRILHEMEANLGFKIFERTSKGVRSTERGAIFLQHAKSIIRELERIDALGPRHPVENRLRICIPRAAFILDLTADYLNTLPTDQNLDSVVRECHARQAIEMLENGEVDVGDLAYTAFLLAMDTKHLCSEDCKGLCPGCGVNLNREPCRCKKQVDPRWAALEQLLDKN